MNLNDIIEWMSVYGWPTIMIGGGTSLLHRFANSAGLTVWDRLPLLVFGLFALFLGLADIHKYRSKLSKAESRKSTLSQKVDELKEQQDRGFDEVTVWQNLDGEVEMRVKE